MSSYPWSNDMCSDSTALVVYTTFRTSSGNSKNGTTRSHCSRHWFAVAGYFVQAFSNASNCRRASSAVAAR